MPDRRNRGYRSWASFRPKAVVSAGRGPPAAWLSWKHSGEMVLTGTRLVFGFARRTAVEGPCAVIHGGPSKCPHSGHRR